MKLKLYTTKDTKNVINKTLINEFVLNIKIRNDFNVLNPTIILTKNNGIETGNFNYAYIPYFDKYYFIDNIEVLNKGAVKISFSIDVLETYKNDILNSECSFKRSLKDGDYFDGNFDFMVDKKITKHESDKTLIKNNQFILTCIGS